MDERRGPGIELYLTGLAVQKYDVNAFIARDQRRLVPLGVAMLAAVLLAFFRRPLGVVLPLGVMAVTVVWTLGIYGLYWIFISFAEVKARRGKGTSGIVGLLLALIPVSIFLLPSHIGDMYAEDGKTKPITGYAGLWALIPLLGGIIIALTSILTGHYRKLQRDDMAATLKMEMIQRGMSVDEIERVLEAKMASFSDHGSHHQRHRHRESSRF